MGEHPNLSFRGSIASPTPISSRRSGRVPRRGPGGCGATPTTTACDWGYSSGCA
jgi:hypothetical protein